MVLKNKEPEVFGNDTKGHSCAHCTTLLSEAEVQAKKKKELCKCMLMKIDGTQILFSCYKER